MDGFALYITTKIPNPSYTPEVTIFSTLSFIVFINMNKKELLSPISQEFNKKYSSLIPG